jgi:hypothetical protein
LGGVGQYDCGMGLCHEFGSQIRSGCDHPMRAGASACSCAECGVVCRGLFDGCPDVWARGPRPVAISATRASAAPPATAPGAAAGGANANAGATVTSLPSGRVDGPRGVRTVSPVAAIGPAAAKGDGGNGAGGGADAGSATAGTGGGDPRKEVFKWFEEAFEGVRLELQTLIASMTHQQAMLAELLDSRQAELRLALVAESLPDVVGDAVRAAMDDHNTAMAEAYDKSHDRFRDDVERVRATTEAKVDSLQESFEKLESVIAVHDEEAEQRETVRLGTLKGSVTRQITPITDALSRLAAKLDDITDRLDDPSPAVGGSAPAGPTRATRSRAPGAPAASGGSPAPPTRTPATSARAASPAPARTPATPARTASPARAASPTPARTLASRARAASPAPTAPAAPAARSRPSAWAPAVTVGPVVARRVTSNRAAAAAESDEDDPMATPPPAKRPAAARRRTATALPVAAEPEPEPEIEMEPEPELEPVAEAEPVAPRPTRRITTRRPPVARPAATTPTNPGNGSRAVPPLVGRQPIGSARVTAPRASSPPEPIPEPPTVTTRRVLGRRPAPVDDRPSPLVTYDLQDDPDGLFGVDDGDDEGWAPPAWVSEAAAKRAAPGRRGPNR